MGHAFLSMVFTRNRLFWKEKLALFGASLEEVVKGLRAVSYESRFKEIRLRLTKRRCRGQAT